MTKALTTMKEMEMRKTALIAHDYAVDIIKIVALLPPLHSNGCSYRNDVTGDTRAIAKQFPIPIPYQCAVKRLRKSHHGNPPH